MDAVETLKNRLQNLDMYAESAVELIANLEKSLAAEQRRLVSLRDAKANCEKALAILEAGEC